MSRGGARAGAGRPAKPEQEKGHRLVAYVTAEEARRVLREAAEAGQWSLSAWIRLRLGLDEQHEAAKAAGEE